MRGWLRGWLIASLAAAAPGCSGCGEKPVEAPAGEAPATAASPATSGDDGPAGRAADPGIGHPLAAGWQREAPPEPAPEARGLYRRALDQLHAGDPAEAARTFARLREEFGDSRFARRLQGGGDPAATAALLGLAATVAAATMAGAVRALEQKGIGAPKPAPKAPPAPR